MKKRVKIYSLIVLLSLITSSNVLTAQANIDSIFKSYHTFFKSNKHTDNKTKEQVIENGVLTLNRGSLIVSA